MDKTYYRIAKYIQSKLEEEFTGKIIINIFKGGVSNIITETSNKLEDI